MDANRDKENQMLLKEYDTLVDLLKHQHVRLLDMNKTFLTFNTILMGICAVIFRMEPHGSNIYLISFGLLGFVFSIIWRCTSERIDLDAELRWFQLRYTERSLGRSGSIFNSGYDFFFNKNKKEWKPPDGKEDPLSFPTGIRGKLARQRVVKIGKYLPIGFAFVYVVVIVMSIYYLYLSIFREGVMDFRIISIILGVAGAWMLAFSLWWTETDKDFKKERKEMKLAGPVDIGSRRVLFWGGLGLITISGIIQIFLINPAR
jgi:hypothetical protein